MLRLLKTVIDGLKSGNPAEVLASLGWAGMAIVAVMAAITLGYSAVTGLL